MPHGKLSVSIVEVAPVTRSDNFGSYSSLIARGMVEMWAMGERYRRRFTVNLESETFFTTLDCAIACHVVATRGDTFEQVRDHRDSKYGHRLKWVVEQELFGGWIRLFGAPVSPQGQEEKTLCCVEALFFDRTGCLSEPRIWVEPRDLLAFADDLRRVGGVLEGLTSDWEMEHPSEQP
jgi:hypothetical protein